METKIKIPTIWDESYNPNYTFLLNLGRKAKKQKMREIAIEALKAVQPQRPTARELQKLTHIRRKEFLKLLRAMKDEGVLACSGTGTKADPYRYILSPDARI